MFYIDEIFDECDANFLPKLFWSAVSSSQLFSFQKIVDCFVTARHKIVLRRTDDSGQQTNLRFEIMIETERLIIRPFVEEDFETLCALRADKEVMKYIGLEYSTPEKVADRLRFYIQSQKQHGFSMCAVILKETNEMIGWAGLQYLDGADDVEVGYGFDKPFWGKGFATEAARAWLQYGFEKIGLKRIVAVAMPENRDSRHVMEKLRMKHEKNSFHYGHLLVYYAIEKSEFNVNERE